MVHGTTIIGLRHGGKAALGGDGQVTFGDTVMKHTARKVRKMYDDRILVGFAGATADAFTLLERFEQKLDEYKGNLPRAAVELAKDWRSDKVLRRLEAMLTAIDRDHSYVISGSGDVVESEDGIVAVGSGGPYALAAARALARHSDLDARAIVEQSILITAEICVYTNTDLTIVELE